jgi:tetratricopeptide (TPR) repeat protein
MNGIQNYEYYVPIDKEPIENRAEHFINQLKNQKIEEKIVRAALRVLKNLADVLTMGGCALLFFGLAASSGIAVILGGAAAALGAACLLCKDLETRTFKLEKAAAHLRQACSYVDEKKFHDAASEIERAQEILPESEIKDTRIYLNLLLRHLRNNEKGKAIEAAEKLVDLANNEIAYFTKVNARAILIDYLKKQVVLAKAVSSDFDRIYQKIEPAKSVGRHYFENLYKELGLQVTPV